MLYSPRLAPISGISLGQNKCMFSLILQLVLGILHRFPTTPQSFMHYSYPALVPHEAAFSMILNLLVDSDH